METNYTYERISAAYGANIFFLLCLALLGWTCSKSNDLLFGRVETKLGNHVVVVTDCYRTSVPPAQPA